MAKKFNFKNKSLWKKIGIGACCGVLGLGAVMGVGALLDKAEETTTKNINPTYAVGGLTEDGKYLETKESIYTKDAFACQGLDIDLAFNNNVSYRVFFYDADNNFISATENLTDNYDENTTPVESYYARIVITPNDDDKVSWYELNGYAKQLEIEVNKEQKEIKVLSYLGNDCLVVDNINNMKYENNFYSMGTDGNLVHMPSMSGGKAFSTYLLKVDGGETITLVDTSGKLKFNAYEYMTDSMIFCGNPDRVSTTSSLTLSDNADYISIQFNRADGVETPFSAQELANLSSLLVIDK